MDFEFPPTDSALEDPNGLLAVGGDLSPKRLVAAYARGIFPWFDESQPILWWSPNPRSILLAGNFHCSRSLKRSIRKGTFSISVNSDFSAVIRACGQPRSSGPGTWISPQMIVAYEQLHELGFAHSIEVFQSGHLVGGLYGVAIGKVFFGESMFSRVSDASKIALATLAKVLDSGQLLLVDCQVENPHLSQMGATNIPRQDFEKLLSNAIKDDQHLLAMTGTSADKLIPRSHPDWLSTIGGDPAGLLEKQL